MKDDFEIKCGHGLGQSGLSPIRLPSFFHDILQVFMVSIYDRRQLTSLKVMPLFLEGDDNGHEFLVMNFVIQFWAIEFCEWKATGCSSPSIV